MKKQFTCIVCPNGCEIEAEVENGRLYIQYLLDGTPQKLCFDLL